MRRNQTKPSALRNFVWQPVALLVSILHICIYSSVKHMLYYFKTSFEIRCRRRTRKVVASLFGVSRRQTVGAERRTQIATSDRFHRTSDDISRRIGRRNQTTAVNLLFVRESIMQHDRLWMLRRYFKISIDGFFDLSRNIAVYLLLVFACFGCLFDTKHRSESGRFDDDL
jgi:hypothetical protein